jgi:hypothetical protein
MANPTSSAISQALPSSGGSPASSPGITGYNDAADPTRPVAAGLPAGGGSLSGDAARMANAEGRRALTSALAGQHASRCFATPGLPMGLWLDQDGFVTAYKALKHEPLFSTLASNKTWEDNLKRFLTSMQNDPDITDVYQASYMMATAMHEGRSAHDKWRMTWSPVEETAGGGQKYWDPVVVKDLDGVPLNADGTQIAPLPAAPVKTPPGRHAHAHKAHPNYPADKFIKRVFNGRGYVQLTWLDNYTSMGEAIGMGNKLACDPTLVLDHDVAYKITSVGMRLGCFRGKRTRIRGQGLSGGHKLADYGHDYVAARAIINGAEHPPVDKEIARYAGIFERLIQDNRLI